MSHLRNGAVGLSLGVFALFACSRVASQTNFIGHPCKADADCPSDLICANEGNGVQTCQNRCLAGAQCETQGYVCQNGACLPPNTGAADGGDFGGSGGTTTGAPDSGLNQGFDGGGTSSGGPVFIGTTIVKDVTTGPAGGSNQSFVTDGTLLAFSASVPGQFGGSDTAIELLHTDTAQFETVGKYIQGSQTTLMGGPVLYSGSAFWLESNSGQARIMKGTPGNAGAAVAISNNFSATAGADSALVVADKYLYLLVTGTPAAMGVYDLTSGTLGTPTIVDSAAAKMAGGGGKGSTIVAAGGSVYWVHTPPTVGADAPIWTGTPGGAGAVSGTDLIPAAALSSFAGLYAGPSGRFFATNSGGTNYSFYDASSTATQRLQLATNTPSNAVSQVSTDLYALVNTSGTTTLNKYTLPSSTAGNEETWGQGTSTPARLTVSGNTAYWVESYSNPQMPTQQLYRYAKATIP